MLTRRCFFDRDVDGVRKYSEHKFGVTADDVITPSLQDVIGRREEEEQVDTIVAASGFRNVDQEGKYGVSFTVGRPSFYCLIAASVELSGPYLCETI